MIDQIIQVVNDKIAALSFVDRLGGVATPVEQAGKSFPITESMIGARCFETGRYKDLLPDHAFESVIFWEEDGPAAFSKSTFPASRRKLGGGFIDMSQNMTLLVWLNLKALGKDEAFGSTGVQMALMRVINRTYKVLTVPFRIRRLSFEVTGRLTRDSNIWAKYTALDNANTLFLYPYDHFALSVQVKATIPVACLPPYAPAAALECANY